MFNMLGEDSVQDYYFVCPPSLIHLFISHLWIQDKIQLNLFSRLDFSYIKANSQKLIILCQSIFITDCQLQDVLRREAKKDINALLGD